MRNLARVVAPVLSLFAVAFVQGCTSETSSAPSNPDPTNDGAKDPSTNDGTPGDGNNGDGTTELKALPSAKAKQVTTGRLHACALTTDGAVRCWGYTEFGQVGNGMVNHQPHPSIPLPVAATGLESGVQAVSTYSDTTCALTASGGVKCWGADESGELGTGIPYTDNRPQLSAVPVDVKDLSAGVRAISVGSQSACAITAAGGVKCWGRNETGRLGTGTVHIHGDLDEPDFLPAGDVVGLTSGVKEVSVGGDHACALMETGNLKCWGSNASGQLGIGDDNASGHGTPVDVTELGSNVAHVSAGDDVTCVIMKDGSAKCMGRGDDGQIGDGKNGIIRNVTVPTDVVGLTGTTQITNTDKFTCAVAAGAVKCWGTGPIGAKEGPNFESYVPVQTFDLTSGWVAVSGGLSIDRYACALSDQGAIKCWGDNASGTLGDGKGGVTGLERSDTPVNVVSFP